MDPFLWSAIVDLSEMGVEVDCSQLRATMETTSIPFPSSSSSSSSSSKLTYPPYALSSSSANPSKQRTAPVYNNTAVPAKTNPHGYTIQEQKKVVEHISTKLSTNEDGTPRNERSHLILGLSGMSSLRAPYSTPGTVSQHGGLDDDGTGHRDGGMHHLHPSGMSVSLHGSHLSMPSPITRSMLSLGGGGGHSHPAILDDGDIISPILPSSSIGNNSSILVPSTATGALKGNLSTLSHEVNPRMTLFGATPATGGGNVGGGKGIGGLSAEQSAIMDSHLLSSSSDHLLGDIMYPSSISSGPESSTGHSGQMHSGFGGISIDKRALSGGPRRVSFGPPGRLSFSSAFDHPPLPPTNNQQGTAAPDSPVPLPPVPPTSNNPRWTSPTPQHAASSYAYLASTPDLSQYTPTPTLQYAIPSTIPNTSSYKTAKKTRLPRIIHSGSDDSGNGLMMMGVGDHGEESVWTVVEETPLQVAEDAEEQPGDEGEEEEERESEGGDGGLLMSSTKSDDTYAQYSGQHQETVMRQPSTPASAAGAGTPVPNTPMEAATVVKVKKPSTASSQQYVDTETAENVDSNRGTLSQAEQEDEERRVRSDSDLVAQATWSICQYIHSVVVTYAIALQQVCNYQCTECIRTLEEGLPAQHFSSALTQQLIGKACSEMNEYTTAKIAFREMIRYEPYRLQGIESYSSVLWQLREEKTLSALAQQVLEVDKSCPETWCVIGNCFSLQKETDAAIRYFQIALQIDPYFTYAYTLCGHEHVNNEDMEKAVTAFRQAILNNDRHYNAWYGLGSIYYRQENFESSEYHFRKARSINNRCSILDCYLGKLAEFFLVTKIVV
jgi:tetratricopeptide (TPR) repeat protein